MIGSLRVERDVPLSGLCTFGVGGPARWLVRVRDAAAVREAAALARRQGMRSVVLGRGSNCLFSDRGFDGLVVVNEIDFLSFCVPEGSGSTDAIARAGSGYPFNALGAALSADGYTGLEFAAGIPGTVGGAVYMNAGADGADASGCLHSVEYVTRGGAMRTVHARDLDPDAFGYRRSPFQDEAGTSGREESDGLFAIVAASFALRRCEGAAERARVNLKRRGANQPLRAKSAGCVFRNPTGGPSAGALIDGLGLKGFAIGSAAVSQVHANFLVSQGGPSRGDANAHTGHPGGEGPGGDMRALIAFVKEAVHRETGYELQEEIRLIE